MKNIKYILLIIVLLFTSCALKKEYIIGDSKGITTKKIVKNIEQNQNKFGSLQARAKIDYSSKNKIKTKMIISAKNSTTTTAKERKMNEIVSSALEHWDLTRPKTSIVNFTTHILGDADR